MKVDLSKYNNDFYQPGSRVKRAFWYLISILFFQTYLFPFSGIKVALLRMFGAKIGKGLRIKPKVLIKYPWFLTIGDHCWIGEKCWIDNLCEVNLGNNVCLSQGAMLLTGNHDYKSPTFDLIVRSIVLEDGAWVGAKAVIGPGVTAGSHSVLSVGSVANKDMEAFTIYNGNPANAVRKRRLGSD